MKGDYHIHTFFSPCAEATMSPDRIVEAAIAAGCAEVGLTDHPYHDGLARHHQALNHARERLAPAGVRIWIGAELEVVAMGELIIPPSRLPLADYLIAAPSHYDLVGAPPVRDLADPLEWADRLLTDLENVCGSGARAVAHPLYVQEIVKQGPAGRRCAPLAAILAEIRPKRLDHILDRFAEEHIALEISPRLAAHPDFERFMEEWYRRAHRRGVKFMTGSDSHRPHTVGRLGPAEDFIRRLGLSADDFWHPSPARP